MAEAVDDPADEQHEASGEEGETEQPAVFMLDPCDHSRQPLVQADQTVRDGIIQSLITSASSHLPLC